MVPAAPGLIDYPDAATCESLKSVSTSVGAGSRGGDRGGDRGDRGGDRGGEHGGERGGDRVFFSGAIWTRPRGAGFYEPSRLVLYKCHKRAAAASRIHVRQTETT